MSYAAGGDAVSVRPMTADDLDAVMAIAEELETAPQWPRSAYETAMDAESLPRRIALSAECEGRVVAYAIASVIPPEAELETIAVAAVRQRGGVGKALLSGLFRELETSGIVAVTLEVRASNSAAQAFYCVAGFDEFARRPAYYSDTGEAAVLMRARIRVGEERE